MKLTDIQNVKEAFGDSPTATGPLANDVETWTLRNLISRLKLFKDMAEFYAGGNTDEGALARSVLKTEAVQQKRANKK